VKECPSAFFRDKLRRSFSHAPVIRNFSSISKKGHFSCPLSFWNITCGLVKECPTAFFRDKLQRSFSHAT